MYSQCAFRHRSRDRSVSQSIRESWRERCSSRKVMQPSEEMRLQRAPLSAKVMRHELSPIRRHVHSRRTFAETSFAREAEIERFFYSRIGKTARKNISAQCLQEQAGTSARGM